MEYKEVTHVISYEEDHVYLDGYYTSKTNAIISLLEKVHKLEDTIKQLELQACIDRSE